MSPLALYNWTVTETENTSTQADMRTCTHARTHAHTLQISHTADTTPCAGFAHLSRIAGDGGRMDQQWINQIKSNCIGHLQMISRCYCEMLMLLDYDSAAVSNR